MWVRVFENRVLRRIFGPKRDEVTGEWRKLKSRRTKLEVHVARMGREEVYTGCLWGNLRERDHLGDQA